MNNESRGMESPVSVNYADDTTFYNRAEHVDWEVVGKVTRIERT
jgi:hypothetical protein